MKFGEMRIVIVVLLLLTISIFVQAKGLSLRTDTLHIHIKIVAKEKEQENFDSIFRSLPTGHTVKNPASQTTKRDKQTITEKHRKEMATGISQLKDTSKEIQKSAGVIPAQADTAISPDRATSKDTSVTGRRVETAAMHIESSQNLKASRISCLWIGFVLTMGGIVLGLIFGRAAFLISAIGLVLFIIGFYIK